MNEAAKTEKEPWTIQLDVELSRWGEGTCQDLFALILKDFLLFQIATPPVVDTARRVDDFYEQEYLPADPLIQVKDDRGMGWIPQQLFTKLSSLSQGSSRTYNSSEDQGKLVRLLLTLRGLPARQFKIWNVWLNLCSVGSFMFALDLDIIVRRVIVLYGSRNQCR